MEKVATIFNGTFTIQSPRGVHKTIDISTQAKDAKFAPGKRLASLLTGPDNYSNYKSFAFVTNDGINVFRKNRGPIGKPTAFEWIAHILWDMATKGEKSSFYKLGYRLLQEGTCICCNRKLTTPESILSGLGPVCGKKKRNQVLEALEEFESKREYEDEMGHL